MTPHSTEKRRAHNSTLPAADPAKAQAWRERGAKKYAEKREAELRRRVEAGEDIGLPDVNLERQKRRQEEGLVKGPHHHWIANEPCVLAGAPGHVCGFTEDQPAICGHHLKTIGSGGEDRNNEVPVCALAHIEFHAAGSISRMCDRHGRDFRSIACIYTERFDRQTSGDTYEGEER
jgi:hypothetical protein